MDKEAERVKPEDWDELPSQRSMKPTQNRKKPSTDQRKTRRKMNKSREDRSRSRRHATILNTSVERVNPGDEIRTPEGNTTKVLNIRRHEYRADYVYLDTELGTIVVKRGTPVQVIVGNASQQFVPEPGHPWGNTDTIPMAGKGPSGVGEPLRNFSTDCPVCGQKNTLYLTGHNWRCRHCGFELKAGTVPFGGEFSNQHRMYLPTRAPGEVPVARVWASNKGIEAFNTGGTLVDKNRSELLRKLANAGSLEEQRTLTNQLAQMDREAVLRAEEEKSLDWANTAVQARLSHRVAHSYHTEQTDWIGEISTTAASEDYHNKIHAEASMWFNRVDSDVKADPDEFKEQARGMARKVTGSLGDNAETAAQDFLRYVAFLYKQSASGLDQINQTFDAHDNFAPTDNPYDVFPTFEGPVHPINEWVESNPGVTDSERPSRAQDVGGAESHALPGETSPAPSQGYPGASGGGTGQTSQHDTDDANDRSPNANWPETTPSGDSASAGRPSQHSTEDDHTSKVSSQHEAVAPLAAGVAGAAGRGGVSKIVDAVGAGASLWDSISDDSDSEPEEKKQSARGRWHPTT